MESGVFRPTTIALQGLILVFSVCLVYFTFVYYPTVAGQVRFSVPFKQLFVDKVVVSAESFPVKTENYKITHEEESGLYYVFVEGATLDKYVDNKHAAQLALKNILAVESLCKQKVIYASSANLEEEVKYKAATDCN